MQAKVISKRMYKEGLYSIDIDQLKGMTKYHKDLYVGVALCVPFELLNVLPWMVSTLDEPVFTQLANSLGSTHQLTSTLIAACQLAIVTKRQLFLNLNII